MLEFPDPVSLVGFTQPVIVSLPRLHPRVTRDFRFLAGLCHAADEGMCLGGERTNCGPANHVFVGPSCTARLV